MNDDTDFQFGHGDLDSLPSKDSGQATESCGGTVECKACGKFHGWCDEISKSKENQMLPNPESAGGGGGKTQKPSNRLQTTDLSRQPREAKIVMVKSDPSGRYGAQVICKIAVNGEVKFWYLDIKKNPNYKLLVDKFGNDENDWVSEKILLGVEKDDFSDNLFIRVSFPEATKTKGR